MLDDPPDNCDVPQAEPPPEPDDIDQTRFAALLAESLVSDGWASNQAGAVPESRRAASAAEAVRLYREGEPFWHVALTRDDDASPFDCAMAVLGEIADGFALHAIQWEPDRVASVPFPSRRAVEAFIRANGVDGWATALGYPLTLSADPEPKQTANAEPEQPIDVDAVAATFNDTLTAYEKLLQLYRFEEGRDILLTWRETACRQVASSLMWSGWVRERLGLDGPYGPLATAMFDMHRGIFLLTWDTSDAPPFATRPYLRDLLRKDDADRWLISHGVELPTWLPVDPDNGC